MSLFRLEKETSSTSSSPPIKLSYLAGTQLAPLELEPQERRTLEQVLSSHSPVRKVLDRIFQHQLEHRMQQLLVAQDSDGLEFQRAAYWALSEFRQALFREAMPRPVPRAETDPHEDL